MSYSRIGSYSTLAYGFALVAGLVLPKVAIAAQAFKQYGLDDPLGGADVPYLIGRIVSWVLPLTGSLFLAMFIWGGITYMTASGESDRVKKATQTLKNAVIGLAIISLAYVLVFNVIDFFGKGLTGGTEGQPGAPQAQSGGG